MWFRITNGKQPIAEFPADSIDEALDIFAKQTSVGKLYIEIALKEYTDISEWDFVNAIREFQANKGGDDE